jgi:hypothetical protein
MPTLRRQHPPSHPRLHLGQPIGAETVADTKARFWPAAAANTPSLTQLLWCQCSLSAEPKRCRKLAAPSRA